MKKLSKAILSEISRIKKMDNGDNLIKAFWMDNKKDSNAKILTALKKIQ